MNPFTDDFHNRAHDTRLTPAERSRVQAALRAHMTQAPVPSPYLAFLREPLFVRSAVVIAAVLVITGSTAYAAEGSLPGDALYAVKVNVTEPITGVLAITPEAKNAWNADVALARVDEAQALAAKGSLDATTSAELAANFSAHADALDEAHADVLRARVTEKSAILLTAAKKSGNATTTRASGNLVLALAAPPPSAHSQEVEKAAFMPARSVPADTEPSAGDEAAPGGEAKRPAVMMLMTTGAPAIDSEPADGDLDLLARKAHDALSLATTTIADPALAASVVAEGSARIDDLAALVVRADAEFTVGSTTEAAADYADAIQKARELQDFLSTPPSADDSSDEGSDAGEGDDEPDHPYLPDPLAP